jgi:hypothetical protein
MKFFISSVISDFSAMRSAAVSAVQALGHRATTAEEFRASPSSPQVACLTGVREADAIILLLGPRYGAVQSSGKSATHEEFDEAKERKPVFAFVQSSVTPEAEQAAFISEVQAWSTGVYTSRFIGEESLRSAVTAAVHQWEVSNAAGRVDGPEMRDRAVSAFPIDRRGVITASGPYVAVSLAAGPHQTVLRPSEIEAEALRQEITQRALFGNPKIFNAEQGTSHKLGLHSLVLSQESAWLELGEDAAMRIVLPLPTSRHSIRAIIEEDVRDLILSELVFASQTLDKIDPTMRLSHVAIAAGILEGGYCGWRTRREQEKNPNSITISHTLDTSLPPTTLSPPHRSRAALRQQASTMVEDFAVLLRRKYKP